MDDSALLDAARAGDAAALAQFFARHFGPVYDFAARLARDSDAGAGIAELAFLAAVTGPSGLHGSAGVRARLFASARESGLTHLRQASPAGPGPVGDEPPFDLIDRDRLPVPADDAEAKAVASLVWEGTSGLDPGQLSLLDLHLRQGLDTAEVGAVLGISRDSADRVLARVQKAFQDRLMAFVLARQAAAGDCTRFAAALATVSTATASPELQRVVDRHVAICVQCQERRRRLVPANVAFAALAAIGPPAGMGERILADLTPQVPRAAAPPRRREPAGAGPEDILLTPPTWAESSGNRFAWRPVLTLVGLGTVVALLLGGLLVPFSPFAAVGAWGERHPSAAIDRPVPTPFATGTPPSARLTPIVTAAPGGVPASGSVATASRTPGPATPTPFLSPAATASGTALVPTPVASESPSSTPAPTSTPLTSPTAPPCVPRLATNGISRLFLAPAGSGSFFIYDAVLCGTVSFTVSAPSWLAVAPASGSIGPANRMPEVTVTAPAGGLAEGPHAGLVSVLGVPAGGQVDVIVTVTVTGSPPEVLSATCTAAGGSWSFVARATDDHAVISVALKFTTGSGNVTLPMSGPDAGTSGTWTASLTIDAGAHGFSVIARDASGQAATVAVSGCS